MLGMLHRYCIAGVQTAGHTCIQRASDRACLIIITYIYTLRYIDGTRYGRPSIAKRSLLRGHNGEADRQATLGQSSEDFEASAMPPRTNGLDSNNIHQIMQDARGRDSARRDTPVNPFIYGPLLTLYHTNIYAPK